MESNNHILLIISISSLLLSLSAEAICVPRNSSSDLSHSSVSAPPKASPSSPVDPAIVKICGTTDNPSLCVSTLTPFLDGKTDPVSVLHFAVQAATKEIEQAIAETVKLLKDKDSLSAPAAYIQSCQDFYGDAIDDLKDAVEASKIHDIGTMNTRLSAVVTDIVTCDDIFAETPDFISPLTETDKKLLKLASNCLAIATLIH